MEKELKIYSKFIGKGDLLIVEGTFLGGHPNLPEHGEGPTEAIEKFFHENSKFFLIRDLSITRGFPIAWIFGILVSCRNFRNPS